MQMGMRMGLACSTVSDKNRKPKYIRVSLCVCVCKTKAVKYVFWARVGVAWLKTCSKGGNDDDDGTNCDNWTTSNCHSHGNYDALVQPQQQQEQHQITQDRAANKRAIERIL